MKLLHDMDSSYSLDELKSRLKMSEIEVKITTTANNGISNNLKKSRKNKTPVFKRRPSSGEENTGAMSPKSNDPRGSSSPESPATSSEAGDKRPPVASGLVLNEPPLPPPPGGIKSYSDFMRSLAAKYNNNDNGLPSNTSASGLESPFQPFKASSPMAPPVVTSSLNPLLGLPSPFPFLSAHGLTSLSDPKAAKTPALPPGLPPGFPGMMDIHSTQALLNLARSGNFLPPTSAPSGGGTSAFSPPASLEATAAAVSKKRPPTSEALDLSPPNNTGSSSSISNNKKAKLELAGNLKSNITATTSGSPSTVLDPTVVLNWKVSDVCQFVSSIDICREYTEIFREHNIDGSALPLLTEDHLTLRLGLKLGPALKLRSLIAKKLGPSHADICVHCAHCNATAKSSSTNEENNSISSLPNGLSSAVEIKSEEKLARSASRNSSIGEK